MHVDSDGSSTMSQEPSTLARVAQRIEAISEWTGRGIAWLTLAMVLVTFAVVVLRYLFNTGWIAMQESITVMHALVFLIGAAYTLKREGHVRVDIFYRKLGPRARAVIDLLGALCLLIPVCLFISWISWEYVSASWSLYEGSREAGGLPGVFLLKSVILIMAALLLLQGIAQILHAILILTGRGKAPEPPLEPEV